METFGQESGELRTREQGIVGKRVEICEQESGDLWPGSGDFGTREWRLLDKTVKTYGHFLNRYIDPVHGTFSNQYTDNSAVLF